MFNRVIGKIAQTRGEKIKNILITVIFIILWIKLAFASFVSVYNVSLQFSPMTDGEASKSYLFMDLCLLTPLWEEFAWRVFPIQIVKSFGLALGKEFQESIMPYVIILSSIHFGFGHGGMNFIFMQGVAGLALSRLYIKNNYSYTSCITVHFLWNLAYLLGAM